MYTKGFLRKLNRRQRKKFGVLEFEAIGSVFKLSKFPEGLYDFLKQNQLRCSIIRANPTTDPIVWITRLVQPYRHMSLETTIKLVNWLVENLGEGNFNTYRQMSTEEFWTLSNSMWELD